MFFKTNQIFSLAFVSVVCMTPVQSDLMIETVQKQQIPIEKHTVITPDGYILGLYHIPAPKNKANNDTKVMYMMHGLFSSSAQYVFFPKDSAAFYFHDYGYDIWLGNGRGNTFSRNHTDLDPEGTEFWKFSWHEIGTIDMPAMIEYILQQTKKQKIIYYGHSQGATTALVLLSERSEFNDKVSSMHLLAPSVVTKEIHLPMQWFTRNVNQIAKLAEKNGLYEVFANDDFSNIMKSLGEVCADTALNNVCKSFIEIFGGPFSPQNSFSKSLISDMAKIGLPAGASVRQAIHYWQCFLHGSFLKYDHGVTENLKLYGSKRPPEYNLSNVRTNVQLMYGTQDYLASESNTNYLIRKMRNAQQIRKDKIELFNHFDFMIRPHLKRVNKIVHKSIKLFEKLSAEE